MMPKVVDKLTGDVVSRQPYTDEGTQRGLEGRGNLKQGLFGTNPAYEGTVTKEIIELSKEIQGLQRKKDSFAAR